MRKNNSENPVFTPYLLKHPSKRLYLFMGDREGKIFAYAIRQFLSGC